MQQVHFPAKQHDVPASCTTTKPDEEEMQQVVTEELPELSDFTNADESFSDTSDVEDDSVRNIDTMSIEDGLRFWALSSNAPHSSVNMVLKLFKKANVKVPSTAKTLLRTKRNPSSEIKEIGGGQYWYRGITKCLLNYFR